MGHRTCCATTATVIVDGKGNSEGYEGGTKHDSQMKIENAETGSLLRDIHKGRPHRDGGRGGQPKSRHSKGGCMHLVL